LLILLWARGGGQWKWRKDAVKFGGTISHPPVASRCALMRPALMARNTVERLTPAAAAVVAVPVS
jgi:hypothetical protein